MTGASGNPNILLIMTDQHRADIMGCMGDPVVRTPNLDRLASEGLLFENVFCQGPLCMPARASFLTELYVRDHGVGENQWDVPTSFPTFVSSLAATGYHTSCIGKMHLWVHGGRGSDATWTRDTRDRVDQMRRYGFTDPIETVGKLATVAIASEYSDHLAQRGLLERYQEWVTARLYATESSGERPGTLPIWTTSSNPISGDDYIDTWHGHRAEQWIEDFDRPQPFFQWIGFPGPHDPWDAPAEYVDIYRDLDMPMPVSLTRPQPSEVPPFKQFLDYFLYVHSDTNNLTDDVIENVRRHYYANVTAIDDAIGSILGAMEARGMLDNTWIIYTSDHGELLGEHRMLTKMLFYDAAVKVPLIIRPPGGSPPRVVRDLVEQIDLAATIRDIAGAASDPGFQGRSLLGWLDGGSGYARNAVYSENFGFGMVRTPTHKLVFTEDTYTPVQFFDLQADPREEINHVNDSGQPEELRDAMELELVKPFLERGRTKLGPGVFETAR